MPNYTPNINLKKPLGTEFYDVSDQNGNMDILDTQIGLLKAKDTSIDGQITTLQNDKGIWIGGLERGISDLNDAQDGVVPFTETSLNRPPGTLFGSVHTSTGRNPNFRIQIAYEDNVDSNGGVYIRKKILTVWGTWYPFGNIETMTTNNWNEAVNNGIYRGLQGGFTNGPSVPDLVLIGTVEVYDSSNIKQTVKQILGTREWQRQMNNGVWTSWIETSPQLTFQSVSNGKTQVASAITDKGVPTASDATFDTLATNIRAIPTGSGANIASGTSTSGTVATPTRVVNGSSAGNRFQLSASVGFIPTFIRIRPTTSSATQEEYVYDASRDSSQRGLVRFQYNDGSYSGVTENYDVNFSPYYINSVGFNLPVLFGGQSYTWTAIG